MASARKHRRKLHVHSYLNSQWFRLRDGAGLAYAIAFVCSCGGPKERVPNHTTPVAPPRVDGESAELAVAEEELTPLEEARRRAIGGEAMIGVSLIISGNASAHPERPGVCGSIPSGRVGPTPSLDVDCSKGPKGKCVAVEVPKEPWEYPADSWDDPAWVALQFNRRGRGTTYHYTAEWKQQTTDGITSCVVVATAQGDIDGDGVLSLFQRRSRAFEEGALTRDVLEKIERPYE